MQNEQMGEILSDLAQNLAEIVKGDPNEVYLYAESNGGSYDAGIFKDVGDEVLYFDPDHDLFEEIARLWAAADPDKKWFVLHYVMDQDHFDARFEYPDDMDPDEFIHDRRERALRKRYGDKPVIYPPLGDEFHEISGSDLSGD